MKRKLTEELESNIRSKINPQYKEILGTESYERDALIQEINYLRSFICNKNSVYYANIMKRNV